MADDPGQWPVGRLLQEARGRRPLRDVARAAEISEGWLRQIERGYQVSGGVMVPARPTDKVLLRIALVVGISPEDLYGAVGRPVDTELVDEIISEFDPAPPSSFGHGGTEGWPGWLERKVEERLRQEAEAREESISALREEVAAMRAERQELSEEVADLAGAVRRLAEGE